MPVINFSLKGNMNIKNVLGHIRSDNRGMSPILIVAIVLSVLLVGGIGFGIYSYYRDPFILAYRSSLDTQNADKVKNIEVSGEISGKLNIAKLIKNSSEDLDASDAELQKILKDLDTDSNFRFGVRTLLDNEKNNGIVGMYIKSENFKFGNFQDFTDREGNLLDLEVYIGGTDKETPEKAYLRLNKLPNYFPILGTNERIELKGYTGTWLDMSDIIKNNQSLGNTSNESKSKSNSNSTMTNNLFTCGFKELNVIDRVRAALVFRGMFSKVQNSGQVDIDGIKATKLDFEMVASDRAKIIESMDSLSKIVCKNTEDLRNDEFVNSIFRDANISKIALTYYSDPKTNYFTKTVVSMQFDEKKLGTNFELKGEFNIKNINNTKVEEPKDAVKFEQFIMGIMGQLQSQMGGTSAMPTSQVGMCPLTQSQITSALANCNSSQTTAGFKNRQGYCNCYIQQYMSSSCNDEEGRFRKLQANCSMFVN